MKENDPLSRLLQEPSVPEPTASLDARVRAAYAAAHQPSWLSRLWSIRITIPAPVFAAVLLLVAIAYFKFRQTPTPPPPGNGGRGGGGEYLTRIETAGFKPLPDGAVRIIRSGESPK